MGSRHFSVVVFVVALLLASVPAAAQEARPFILDPNEPAAAVKEGKVLHAHRLAGAAPKIDGVLDDAAWAGAEVGEGLTQRDPDNGQPLSERTRFQIVYDDRFIYVAVRCDDRTPGEIARGLGRRDEFPPTDIIGIGFDPRHDHLTGYVFNTNPSGVQQDVYLYDDENSDRDFNAVWEVRTSITAEGWIAEYRIPFSQMRFSASAAGQVWGFGVRRQIRRRSESGEWTARPRGERGQVSRWGHLVFDTKVEPPRRVEWTPYALGGGTHEPSGENSATAGAGLDLRVGLGQSATLSATVNPDFAQVEQDPSVLNLTIFETFFPEKRPFFLEDSRTFIPPYGLFQVFHSRRIGRRPGRFGLQSGDVVTDRPDQTTILGAAKLTGKGSGWTYGAMSAVTGSEHAAVTIGSGPDALIGQHAERLIEPATSYNVGRVQRDIKGSSNVGVIATSVLRNGDTDAFAGGFDYNLRFDRNRSSWNGHWVATHTLVNGEMKTGAGGVTNFNFSRKHGGVFSHFDHFTPTFNINDLGFFRTRPNRTELDAGFSLEQPDPWKKFRNVEFFFNTGQAWNDEKLVFNRFAGASVGMQFLNFWSVSADAFHNSEVLDDLDTRGGPPILVPAGTSYFFAVNSDSRKPWRLNLGVSGSRNDAGGWEARVGPGLTLQPSPRVQASISAGITRAQDNAQWITNTDATGDGVTDYVYGTLNRHVVDATFRATYALHRDLTLQVFLQPFVAVGDYVDIRRLAKPRSYEFEPVTLDYDPDFNSKSLRGNIVLRWEFVRGSTMYVAWNMSTSDEARPGQFAPWRDLSDAFRAPGTHALLVKVSYWLSR